MSKELLFLQGRPRRAADGEAHSEKHAAIQSSTVCRAGHVSTHRSGDGAWTGVPLSPTGLRRPSELSLAAATQWSSFRPSGGCGLWTSKERQ